MKKKEPQYRLMPILRRMGACPDAKNRLIVQKHATFAEAAKVSPLMDIYWLHEQVRPKDFDPRPPCACPTCVYEDQVPRGTTVESYLEKIGKIRSWANSIASLERAVLEYGRRHNVLVPVGKKP